MSAIAVMGELMAKGVRLEEIWTNSLDRLDQIRWQWDKPLSDLLCQVDWQLQIAKASST